MARPVYSIIVPVFEQWHLIPELVKCLEAQVIDTSAYEVILVDNNTPGFVAPALPQPPFRITSCAQPGSYAARNAGAALAEGDWLVFTDADCWPRPEWLAQLDRAARTLERPTLIVGAVEVISRAARPNSYEIYEMVRGIPQQRYAAKGFGATANLAVPRPIFMKLHGFDDRRLSGGDAEFCRRAHHDGIGVHYAGAALVEHPARATWAALKTKAERIEGGQIRAGSRSRRLSWIVRTLMPPVIAYKRFLSRTSLPLRYRFIAIAIQTRLWLHEIRVLAKLLSGADPERR